MLKNHLKIALRNIIKNKTFSFINISGLALGLTCSICIFLWVKDEVSFDKFHEKGKNIFLVMVSWDFEGEKEIISTTQGPLGPVLEKDIPEIESYTRIIKIDWLLLKFNELKIRPSGYVVDSTFFKIFTFPLISGNINTVLDAPNSIVLTQTTANKLFGSVTNALGKIVNVNLEGNEALKVTAIVQDPPFQSSLQFDYLIPYPKYREKNKWVDNWGSFSMETYVQVTPETENAVTEKMKFLLSRHKGDEEKTELFLHNIADIYLYSDFSDGRIPSGKIKYVWIFTFIAIIVLVLACINYMNLSTARAEKRAKEVCIKKVNGAHRLLIILQFLSESIVMTTFAGFVAITLTHILLPIFNTLTHKTLSVPFSDTSFIASIGLVVIITGILSGSYPAFYLSSFNPVRTLKGRFKTSSAFGGVRKSLVVLQFTISIVLIVFTLVIFKQISYMTEKDLGIDKSQIMAIEVPPGIQSKKRIVREELLALTNVEAVSFINGNPINTEGKTSDPTWPGKSIEQQVNFHVLQADLYFPETFGLEIIEGEQAPDIFSDDQIYYLVNEKAVSAMRIEKPIGLELEFWRDTPGKIIGVVKDFHHHDLFKEIEPVIIRMENGYFSHLHIKLNDQTTNETIANIENIYNKYEQDYQLSFQFLDDQYQSSYETVTVIGKLARFFAFTAILISCMGLFALSAFLMEQRTKETGIRKILGATLTHLLYLFSKEYIRLIAVSILTAAPITWLVITGWLSNFAYKTVVNPDLFLIAALSTIGIVAITVSIHILKISRLNPTKALKSE